MSVMTIEGVVEGGQIRLPEDIHLPEHTKVYVVVPGIAGRRIPLVASPRLAHSEDAAEFVLEIIPDSPDAGV